MNAATPFPVTDYDVAIVGAGLSGTIAAITLGRAGYRVALIDRNEVFPPEFRVEKVGGDQIDKLRRLDLLDALEAAATRFDEILNIRSGRVIDRTRTPHYGLLYDQFVGAMRRQVPENVRFLVARVTDVATGPEHQTVVTSEGEVSARLVVLAGGMSDLLRARLGIERRIIHERQSITFGFDVVAPDNRHPALTFYGRQPADGIDYLTLFPASGALRANLFTFLDYRHPWIKAVRQDPAAALNAALPDLTRTIGPFTVPGKVHTWVMDISVADNPVRDGVVLIGDAFQTSCPAAGTGVSRLLTDVTQLCRIHIPQWLATPGMAAEKIARFYADPDKLAMDARALGLADYRRNLTVDTGLRWRTRRQAMYVRRRVLDTVDRVSPSLRTLLRSTRNRFA